MKTKPSLEPVINEAIANGNLAKWAEIGATNAQIADFLHIGETTFYKFKSQNPEISKIISRARQSGPVVGALHGLVRSSTGFHEKTVRKHRKIITMPDGSRRTEEEVFEDDVYVPPNPTACARILATYMNPRKGEGIPTEYVAEPVPVQTQEKTGRLTEMDEAMRQLFFGENKDAQNT